MREIKFRAWDKDNHIMHFQTEQEDGIVWEVWPNIRFLELRTVDSFPGGKYHIQEESWAVPEQVLMQYTGLKDKNGKEIYEKDLVNDGGVVTFLGGRYIIVYGNGDNWEDLIGEEDEIIGNIYESDLLPTQSQDK